MSRILGELFRKATNIKSKVEAIKAELTQKEVEAVAGDGAVRVVVSCDKKIVSIDISADAIGNPPDIVKLKTLVLKAANDALSKAGEIQKETVKKALGKLGISLPDIF